MMLSVLLRTAGLVCRQPDAEVSGVTDALSCVKKDSVFVCICGARFDGHVFAAEAERKGAVAVIAQTPASAAHCYCVPDSRRAFSLLAAAFYGRPHERLRLIGITGTNGKTTTAFYLRAMLEAAGERCAMLGTLGTSVDGKTVETGYTTPKSDMFFAALQKAADRGCGWAVAEISSQALAQKRVDGAEFRLGIVTNVGRDHLDYHGTAVALAAAKARLCLLSRTVLLNADDRSAPVFYEAAERAGAEIYDYSCDPFIPAKKNRFYARNVGGRAQGADLTLCCGAQAYPARINAPGRFSVYNALAAFSAAVLCGVSPALAAETVKSLPQAPGRAQTVLLHGIRVCVDYAHTPDALLAILRALQTDGKKPIAVFGCGGDRDRGKRPLMGRIAAENAAVVILTSDNPRGEDPERIISEIAGGIPAGTRVFREPDRRAAIGLALELASPGDTVLIAGKGHETSQIIGEEKLPFSDMEEVMQRCRREEDGNKQR